MTRNTKYTIALGKGCGLIEETLTLLSVCDEHTTKDSLAKYVHEQNLLSRCSDMRSMDIVKLVFYPRFMKHTKTTGFLYKGCVGGFWFCGSQWRYLTL